MPDNSRTNLASSWEVIFHDEFEAELLEFDPDSQDALLIAAKALALAGPRASRPFVGSLKGSRHANMKELRFSADGGVWRDCYLVITDNDQYDTMGWTMLVADGRSPSAGASGLPIGISSERGQVKLNTDGRSLIFSTLDGGPRDRNAEELGAFLGACQNALALPGTAP
jgi:hypothetical protein